MLLRSIFLFVFILLLSACQDSDKIIIRYAHVGVKNEPQSRFADEVAIIVNSKTEGRLEMRVYPNSQLGNISELVDGVKYGFIGMSHHDFSSLSKFHKDLSVFNAPYIFRDVEHALLATNPQTSPVLSGLNKQLIENSGVRILGSFYRGARQLTTDFPVYSTNDLKGKKIRGVPFPIWMSMIKGMGAIPTPINSFYNTPRDQYFARTQMWGNIFSGGIAGHMYGTVDWNSTIEANQPGKSDNVYIWEALKMKGLKQVQHIEPFMRSEGSRYQNLEPVSENLNPRYSPADKEKGKDLNNLDGRAHMLRTPDKKLCYLYFEGKCNKATVSGLLANQSYEAKWYNPRTGEWSDIGNGSLTANGSGVVTMPDFPGGLTQTAKNTDWAATLVHKIE